MSAFAEGAQRFWALVERQAAVRPEAVAVVDERDAVLTFGGLATQAESLAGHLAARGIGPGDTVAWQLPTGLPAIVLVAALARLDVVQVPLLPIYRERELRFILREARPRMVLARRRWREHAYVEAISSVLREIGGAAEVVEYGDEGWELGDSTAADLPAPPRPSTEPPVRWVFYTSGTTGDPKGALHTDATVYAGSAGVARAYAITEGDRYPIVFPFTHIGGIGMLVIQLITGCSAVAVEQFVPDRTPELLARQGITIAAGGTPLALVYLARQRLQPGRPLFPRLRAVMTGAAPKPPGLHDELRAEMGGSGALACYGLTEAPFLTVSDVTDPDDRRADTEGRAIAGAVLRIVAIDGSECPVGVVGEIQARGPQICRGYLAGARDADAFQDGWFRTGDLGALDENGYLTITGRVKDVIIRKGENIAAREVEDVLYGMDAVADVAVIGLPDDVLGERCCAVVVVREGFGAPSLEAVASRCRDAGLAVQKTPEQLEIVKELPRNAAGKVLKHELRARLAPLRRASTNG